MIQVKVPPINPLVASNIACDIVDSSGFDSFAQAVEAVVPVSYALLAVGVSDRAELVIKHPSISGFWRLLVAI